MLRASLISLIALGVVAQEPAKPAPKPAKPAATSVKPAAKPGKAAPAVAPVVLARVGDERITEADFQSAFRLLGQQEQMQVLMVQGGKEEFVKRMAESKLLSVKAKRLGLDKSPEFQIALQRAKDDLLAREFLVRAGDALKKKLVVDEAAVQAFYASHPERFKQPELASVRHILVAVKQDPKAEVGHTDDEAKALIATIQAELKGGAKFEDLAKKYTDDPGSKENGGLYADADTTSWVPEFGAAARTQPVGEVGAPVKTMYGYHLIKVEGRKPARQVPFEEAKGPAEKMAQQDRQAKVWNELMDDLRKEISFKLIMPAAAPAPIPAPVPVAQPASVPEAPAKAEPAPAPEPVKPPEPVKGGGQ
jgi:parvulin-like peptidyl-prolyl isomerase